MKSPSQGEWSKNFVLWFWYPLATFCLIVGCTISANYFGESFDWRYCTLSSLSTAKTNPHGYAYSCLGLMISFTMGLPICGYIKIRFDLIAPKAAWFSSNALKIGFLGVVTVGLERLTSQSFSVPTYKIHEYISIITFFGLLLGIAGYWICLTRWLLHERHWPVWGLSALSFISVGPIIGTGLSQAYLYFFPNHLGWVGPKWAEAGVPVYLSFAFWEWLTCAGIFIYLFLILFWLPAEAPLARTGAANARIVSRPEGSRSLDDIA